MTDLPDYRDSKSLFEISYSESMRSLASRIIAELFTELETPVSHSWIRYKRFPSGEWKSEIPHTVRGKHVFYIHDMQAESPDAAAMRLFTGLDAFSRASVETVSLILPYLTYQRQDRKDESRAPISARMMANLIEAYRPTVRRMITFDLHTAQAQGFFAIPVDDLSGRMLHAEYVRSKFKEEAAEMVVVSPDYGSSKRSDKFARQIGCRSEIAIIEKQRDKNGKAKAVRIIGTPVKGRRCILLDDMIDTGGSIIEAADLVAAEGGIESEIFATHGLLSNDAAAKFRKTKHRVVVTETVPKAPAFRDANREWLTYLPIDRFLAKAIHEATLVGGSVSKLST